MDEEDTCSRMASRSSWVTSPVVLVTYHSSTRVTIEMTPPPPAMAWSSVSRARSESLGESWPYQTRAWESATTLTTARSRSSPPRWSARSPPSSAPETPSTSRESRVQQLPVRQVSRGGESQAEHRVRPAARWGRYRRPRQSRRSRGGACTSHTDENTLATARSRTCCDD